MAKTDTLFRSKQSQVSPCNTTSNPWMVNSQGLDPCMQVEQLCVQGPTRNLGNVTGSLSCPSSNNPNCCCAWATYALLSACWVCQGHNPVDIDTGIKPSYSDFFNNSGCFVSNVSGIQFQPNDPPISSWASIIPNSPSNHWNFTEAYINATAAQQSVSQSTTTPSTAFPFPTLPVATSLSTSSKPTSPGTIAAAVLGSLALTSLVSIGAWFVWRWRRRYVIRLDRGIKVDLMEPEMEGPSHDINVISGTADPLRGVVTFPFPYQAVVPRHHPNASHSLGPSGTDAREPSDSGPENRTSRRHTSPAPLARLPIDQLDRDLARLQGVNVSSTSQVIDAHLGEGTGQVHHPYIHKTPRKRAATITTFTSSSNSGSGRSRRTRRMSGGEGVAKGRYFHLPPSAQYLANVARYPEQVDPERPWDIRRDGRVS